MAGIIYYSCSAISELLTLLQLVVQLTNPSGPRHQYFPVASYHKRKTLTVLNAVDVRGARTVGIQRDRERVLDHKQPTNITHVKKSIKLVVELQKENTVEVNGKPFRLLFPRSSILSPDESPYALAEQVERAEVIHWVETRLRDPLTTIDSNYFSHSSATTIITRVPPCRVLAAALRCNCRLFFQGGPPPGQPGSKSKAQEYMKSNASEMDERQEAKRADHESYYGSQSKPMPLFENAFKPGEFGMRRRLVVLKRKEKKRMWTAKERGDAVADAQTSFLKAAPPVQTALRSHHILAWSLLDLQHTQKQQCIVRYCQRLITKPLPFRLYSSDKKQKHLVFSRRSTVKLGPPRSLTSARRVVSHSAAPHLPDKQTINQSSKTG
eukprot:gene12536-8589_t